MTKFFQGAISGIISGFWVLILCWLMSILIDAPPRYTLTPLFVIPFVVAWLCFGLSTSNYAWKPILLYLGSFTYGATIDNEKLDFTTVMRTYRVLALLGSLIGAIRWQFGFETPLSVSFIGLVFGVALAIRSSISNKIWTWWYFLIVIVAWIIIAIAPLPGTVFTIEGSTLGDVVKSPTLTHPMIQAALVYVAMVGGITGVVLPRKT